MRALASGWNPRSRAPRLHGRAAERPAPAAWASSGATSPGCMGEQRSDQPSAPSGSYFLIKLVNGDPDTVTETYYVFPSDSDRSSLEAMDVEGYSYESLPAVVEPYKEAVAAMIPFSEADFPGSLDDFIGRDISLGL